MRVPVSSNDAMWLQESPQNPMVINAVAILDRIDLDTLRQVFTERVIEAGEGRRFARMRCRIVHQNRRAHWEPDPDFAIERHIYPPAGAPPRTLDELQAFVGREASRPLPKDRPRWQFHFIEDFEDGASALVVRIHHSIADGLALVALLFDFMDSQVLPPEQAESRRTVPVNAAAVAVRVALETPGILLKRLLWWPDRHSLHGPQLSGDKRVAWTAPLDLAVVKAAKNQLGATVNDVLMASVSGAFTRYLAPQVGSLLTRLRVSMPVNVRPAHEPLELENRFAAVPLEIPAGDMSLEARIQAMKARMDDLKSSVAPLAVYGIQKALLALLPESVSRGLIDFLANKCTAVVTNVPGPPGDLSLAGRRVRGLLFWVPQRANIGVGISILSFAGKVQVGVMTDAHLLSDPAELVRAFEAEFDALRRFN